MKEFIQKIRSIEDRAFTQFEGLSVSYKNQTEVSGCRNRVKRLSNHICRIPLQRKYQTPGHWFVLETKASIKGIYRHVIRISMISNYFKERVRV